MRLLFLNRCYGPDSEATGQLLADLCNDLARVYDVYVVAGPSSTSGGWVAHEHDGDVRIVRTWGTRLAKTGLRGRLLNLGSYYALALVGALRLGRVDIAVAETDPPLLGLLGAALKQVWGCKFVYYCQDIYPDVAQITGGIRNRALLRLLAWANEVAYRAADRIVVLGDDMRELLAAKGVDRARIAVVPNWVDTTQIRPLRQGPLRAQMGERFVIMYSGNFGLAQPLEILLRAAERLRDDDRFAFVLVGGGARRDSLTSWVRRAHLENVAFLPFQPKAQLSESLGAADLHVVPMRDGLGGCLVPSKIYGVLAAGRPVVALMQADADVARLVVEAAVGWVVAPDDVEGLVGAFRDALSDPARLAQMGARARQLAVARFDRANAAARFAAVLEEIQVPD